MFKRLFAATAEIIQVSKVVGNTLANKLDGLDCIRIPLAKPLTIFQGIDYHLVQLALTVTVDNL
jgi:hypothetical protein